MHLLHNGTEVTVRPEQLDPANAGGWLSGSGKTKQCAEGDARGGPAFLVYYAPAFLQSLASEDAHVALLVLSDVYRAARALWPLEKTAEMEARTVTINVGALRGLSALRLSGVHAKGSCWRLVQRSIARESRSQMSMWLWSK